MYIQELKTFFLSLNIGNIILFSILSVLLCLAWLFLCLRLDREAPEPKKQIVRMFFWGGFMVFPAFFIAGPLSSLVDSINSWSYLIKIILLSFLIDGLVEEFIKYTILSEKIYRKPFFDEPRDGIIYGMIVGIGFSLLENFFYGLTMVGTPNALFIMLARGIITTFMHLLAGGIIGYHFGLAKFIHQQNGQNVSEHKKRWIIFRGLILAIIFHGLYNLIIRFGYSWLMYPLAIYLIAVYVFIILGLRKMQASFQQHTL